MRSALRIAAVYLIIGCLLNIAIAWCFALWASPGAAAMGPAGMNPLFVASLRREFFERPGPDPDGRDPGRLFVTVAYQSLGAQFLDVAVEDADIPTDAFRGPLPYIGVVRTGWPLPALEGQWHHDASRRPNPPPPKLAWAVAIPNRYISANRMYVQRMLPLKPMWRGFAVNSVCFAALAGLPPVIRVIVRLRRRQCIACGYPIGISPVCTECGRRVRPRRSIPA